MWQICSLSTFMAYQEKTFSTYLQKRCSSEKNQIFASLYKVQMFNNKINAYKNDDLLNKLAYLYST